MTELPVADPAQDLARGRAEVAETCRTRLVGEVAGKAGSLAAVRGLGLGLDQVVGLPGSLTAGELEIGFLPERAIPAAKSVADTAARRRQLLTAAKQVPAADIQPGANRRFRNDGRNPWSIIGVGFKHRTIPQDIGTVGKELRQVAADHGIKSWAGNYRQKNNNMGVPAISFGAEMEGLGGSNSRWQYAIDLPGVSYRKNADDVPDTVLGGPNKKGSASDATELCLDADTVDGASIVIVTGGPMGEVTFLTPVLPEWVVAFRRVYFDSGDEWREPFEGLWRTVDQAGTVRALLEKYDEFTFPE
jgi:hypothetical protein